jgi:hypothetical protein
MLFAAMAACGDDVETGNGGGGEFVEYCTDPSNCRCASDISTVGRLGPVPPDELGHWSAARIDLPTGSDHEITALRYGLKPPLVGGDDPIFARCMTDVAHRVMIVVSSKPEPPVDPEPAWEAAVTAESSVNDLAVTRTVDPPVVVPEGGSALVLIEMAGTSDAFVCVWACAAAPEAVVAKTYWSNDDEAPFENWVSLDRFGIEVAIDVGITARPVNSP